MLLEKLMMPWGIFYLNIMNNSIFIFISSPRRYELRRLALYIQDIIGKTPDCGFKVSNLRWNIDMKLRLELWSQAKMFFKKPKACWEKVERVCLIYRFFKFIII